MSAIAGFVNFCRSRPDPTIIQRMQLAMTPYGRDAQHQLCTAQGAFCRTLLRTTPEDALDRQPLVHAATGSVLLFDGRIDNRDELATRLAITADELKTLADSDIVQRGLLDKGTDFIEHLVGDFALAWFNRAEQQLHLARDAMGIRPIYWHRSGDTLVFATLPKGIFAHPGIAREIDRTTVNDFLCLLPQQGERSFYQGVQRVEPGRHVVFTQSGQRKRVFFDVTEPAGLVARSEREHIEALRAMTEQAVVSQLRAS